MKEAMGGISLFQIVVVFLLLFTAVMCLTINHSKAFGVKDEIINILENDVIQSGAPATYNISDGTVDAIVDHLNDVGHRITGECPNGYTGYDRNGNTVNNNTASFCIRAVSVNEGHHTDAEEKCDEEKCIVIYHDIPSMVYYDVALFYQLDIPIIGHIFNLRLYGSTKILFG